MITLPFTEKSWIIIILRTCHTYHHKSKLFIQILYPSYSTIPITKCLYTCTLKSSTKPKTILHHVRSTCICTLNHHWASSKIPLQYNIMVINTIMLSFLKSKSQSSTTIWTNIDFIKILCSAASSFLNPRTLRKNPTLKIFGTVQAY